MLGYILDPINEPIGKDDIIERKNAVDFLPFFDDKRPKYSVFVDYIKKMGFLYCSATKKYYIFDKNTGVYELIDESNIKKEIHYLWQYHTHGSINFYSRDLTSIMDLIKSFADTDSLDDKLNEFLLNSDIGYKYEIGFYHEGDAIRKIRNKNRIIPFKNGLFNTDIEEILRHCRYIFTTDPYNHHFTLIKREELDNSSIKVDYLSIFPDEDTLNYYLFWVGSLLFDEKPLPCFLNFIGRTSGGKSLICTILQEILGNSATEIQYNKIKEKHGSAIFDNKILAIAHETYRDNGDIEKIKNYVAKDTMVVEHKYKEELTTQLITRFIICGNEYLNLTHDPGDAIKRRIRVIKFNNFISMSEGTYLYEELSSKKGKDWLVSAAFYLWKDNLYNEKAEENMQSLSMAKELDKMVNFDPFINWILGRCGSMDIETVRSHFHKANTYATYEHYYAHCIESDETPSKYSDWKKKMSLEFNIEIKYGSGKKNSYFT